MAFKEKCDLARTLGVLSSLILCCAIGVTVTCVVCEPFTDDEDVFNGRDDEFCGSSDRSISSEMYCDGVNGASTLSMVSKSWKVASNDRLAEDMSRPSGGAVCLRKTTIKLRIYLAQASSKGGGSVKRTEEEERYSEDGCRLFLLLRLVTTGEVGRAVLEEDDCEAVRKSSGCRFHREAIATERTLRTKS
jgi:hypothetical protein